MSWCTQRCPDCPTLHDPSLNKNVVPGDGPDDARVMAVLEGPGRFENNIKRPAVGPTGDELNNTYFPRAGLSRPDVFVTNAFKCHWADSGDTPPEHVIKSCADFHLRRELAMVRPKYLVLCGGISVGLTGKDLEMQHGLPFWGKLYDWEGWIFPTYHPARGFHKSNDMQALLDDFAQLKRLLRGNLQPLKNAHPNPTFTNVTSKDDVGYHMYDGQDDTIAIDTESEKTWKGYKSTIRYKAWCLTASNRDDSAFMIRANQKGALSAFHSYLGEYKRIIFHNAPHDVRILAEMGIDIDWSKVVDTMSTAYHDGRVAKGLKSLCYRLLGITMKSFDSVVEPKGYELALGYLAKASRMVWPEPVQEPTGQTKLVKCPDCKGDMYYFIGRGKNRRRYDCSTCDLGFITKTCMTAKKGMNYKLKLAITALEKGDIEVWDRWAGWGLDVEPLIAELGPMPIPSIEQVNEQEALEYACGDAHGTRLLYPVLKKRIVEIRRSVRER